MASYAGANHQPMPNSHASAPRRLSPFPPAPKSVGSSACSASPSPARLLIARQARSPRRIRPARGRSGCW